MTTQAMTTTVHIVFEPRPEPGECYVCEIELGAHDGPRFGARDGSGELYPDCLGEVDPPRSAALRALAYAQRPAFRRVSCHGRHA